MKKTILTLIAIITLLSTVAVLPTYAALPDTGGTVEPMWDNTATLHIAIDFPGNGYGYAETTVIGKVGVTKITVDISVYRQVGSSWVLVTEDSFTINFLNGIASCPFPAVTGAYYKAEYEITVTRDGIDEIITKTKYATCS